MQCPICGFQNMPGQETCVSCGVALAASRGLAVEFMPPRAHSRGFGQPLRYRLNAALDAFEDSRLWRAISSLTGIDSPPVEPILLVCLSLLPGLGHWKARRRRGAVIASCGWLALAAVAVSAFGSDLTGYTIGILVAWHAAVMFDAGRIRSLFGSMPRRWAAMAILLGLAALPYLWIHHMVYRMFDFLKAPLDVASCDLKAGDLVLVRRRSYALADIERGDAVAFVSTGNGTTYAAPGLRLQLDTVGAVVGRVAALPEDRVEISAEGLRLDPELPWSAVVPQRGVPLPDSAVTFAVPPGHVLVPVPVRLPDEDIVDAAVATIWTKMFTVKPEDIQGQPLMVYQPLGRRRFIRARESSRD